MRWVLEIARRGFVVVLRPGRLTGFPGRRFRCLRRHGSIVSPRSAYGGEFAPWRIPFHYGVFSDLCGRILSWNGLKPKLGAVFRGCRGSGNPARFWDGCRTQTETSLRRILLRWIPASGRGARSLRRSHCPCHHPGSTLKKTRKFYFPRLSTCEGIAVDQRFHSGPLMPTRVGASIPLVHLPVMRTMGGGQTRSTGCSVHAEGRSQPVAGRGRPQRRQ